MSKLCSMFKTVQRYLAAHFIPPFLFSTIFFVAFLLTFQLFRIMRVVVGKGVDWLLVLELTGHIAASFIPMAVPISILFAAIFTMNKLSEDSEVVAMRAFGLTKGQLFRPFLILSLIISALVFSLNRNLIPYSRTQFKNTIIMLTSQGVLSDISPGQFYTEIPGVTLFAEEVYDDGSRLKDVLIHLQKESGPEERVIAAKSGVLIKQRQGDSEWDVPSIRMHLKNGNISKSFAGTDQLQLMYFEEYDFPVLSNDYRPGFVTKDGMRTNRELKEVIDYRSSRIQKLQEKKKLSGGEKRELEKLKHNLPETELEFWSRFNIPLQCLVFMMLGFALGIKQGRGKSRNSGSVSLLVMIGYYAIFFTGVSFAKKGEIPAYMVVFVPTLLAGSLGFYYYKKLDWLS